MTKEEIKHAADGYADKTHTNAITRLIARRGFKRGALWADEHMKEENERYRNALYKIKSVKMDTGYTYVEVIKIVEEALKQQ